MAALWNAQQHTKSALLAAKNAQLRERGALRFTFAASDQITSRALSVVASPGSTISPEDRQFCRMALSYYQQIADRYRGDLEMRRISAAADHRVGFIRMILDEAGAEEAYRRSIDLYDMLQDVSAINLELATEQTIALADLAILYRRTRRPGDAAECLRKVIEIQQTLVRTFPAASLYLQSLLFHQTDRLALLEQVGNGPAIDEARRELRETYTLALTREPGNPKHKNNFAWALVSQLAVEPHDLNQSIALAHEAVELQPDSGIFWNTLGVAYCRARDWKNAALALGRSIQLRNGGDPYDWFFLAMVHEGEGQHETACQWFERAVRWRSAHAQEMPNPELDRFQNEARQALKLASPT
jgi:tetratricopeptide (TPR) repeat protein